MKRIYILSVLIALALTVWATDMIIHKTDGSEMSVMIDEIDSITFAEWDEMMVEDMTIKWRMDDMYIYLEVFAPTNGWIAIGFDPQNQMQGSDIKIGYIQNNNLMIRDDYGNTPTGHVSDESMGGTTDIMGMGGMEDESGTTIKFKMPLNSEDEYDKVFNPAQSYVLILAYGSADNFTGYHTERYISSIQL